MAEELALGRESASLSVRESKPAFAELLFQYAVLLAQVVDDVRLLAIHPSGERCEEQLESDEIGHDAVIVPVGRKVVSHAATARSSRLAGGFRRDRVGGKAQTQVTRSHCSDCVRLATSARPLGHHDAQGAGRADDALEAQSCAGAELGELHLSALPAAGENEHVDVSLAPIGVINLGGGGG